MSLLREMQGEMRWSKPSPKSRKRERIRRGARLGLGNATQRENEQKLEMTIP